MIRKNISSQNISKSPLKKQNMKTQQKTSFRVMHQLDCIYQGEVNQSYQREGFGIQQTIDFQTYLGWWKNNKANGLGLIIFPNSNILYGHFKDNQLCGVAITDDKKYLQIGVFQKYQIIGIGFDYNYQDHKWRMSKYHKGIPIETISQLESPIQNGVPKIVNVDQKIFTHLYNYISKNYFPSSKKVMGKSSDPYTQMYFHRKNKYYDYFGQQIQGKYYGLGVLYDFVHGKVLEVGTYQNGQLNQYGIKFDHQNDKMEIGNYNKGRKEGFFYQKTKNIQKITQYRKNQFVLQHPKLKSDKIKSEQKLSHYRKNDFFSDKNGFQFNNIQNVFQSNEQKIFKRDRQERQKKTQKKKNQLIQNLKTSKSPGKQKQQKTININTKKGFKVASTIQNKYVLQNQFQKSSVQIMKQKLFDIQNMIYKSKHRHRGTQKKTQEKGFTIKSPNSPKSPKSSKNLKVQQKRRIQSQQQNFSDDIALEEKPLDPLMIKMQQKEKEKLRWRKNNRSRSFNKTSPFSKMSTSFIQGNQQVKKKRIFVHN